MERMKAVIRRRRRRGCVYIEDREAIVAGEWCCFYARTKAWQEREAFLKYPSNFHEISFVHVRMTVSQTLVP